MNVFGAALCLLISASPPPDALFYNARVFTADPRHPAAEAFAVAGGRIVGVGESAELLKTAGPETRLVDLSGNFVSPGFGDAHLHFMKGSLTLTEFSLDGLTSVTDIQESLAAYARAHPRAPWISGRGWNYGAFPGGLPHRKWLDEVVADRPVFLVSYDGHTGWANTKALTLAGIDRDTGDPENGMIVRDDDREPTGALKEAAQDLIGAVMPEPSQEDKYRALKAGLALAASYGLTFAHNAGIDIADLPVYERVMREGGLKLRFHNAAYFEPDPDAATLKRMKELRAKYTGSLFQFGAIKAFADGVVESKTAWMIEPFVGGGGRGRPTYPVDVLNRSVAAYDREGFQMLVHAIGDQAIRATLDAFAYSARVNGTSGRRHRLEHIEVPQFSDLARFKPLGVIASTQALFATPDDDDSTPGVYFGNLGPDRASRTMPFRAIDGAGAVQAFGSDWPVYSMEVLKGIYTAVTRQTTRGTPRGGQQPQSKISAEAALRHFTTDAAYAGFAENEYGRIAPGLQADFVVLSEDVTKIPPADILRTRVLLTVVGGQETFRARGFTPGAGPAPK